MKRILKLLLVLAVVLLVYTGAPHVLAAESIAYDALFEQSLVADGFAADHLATELADCYDQNPDLFVSKLSMQEEQVIDYVVHLLVYEYEYRDINALKDHMNSIGNDPSKTDSERTVAQSVLAHIDSNNCPIAKDPEKSETPEDPWSGNIPTGNFNPYIVRSFIDTFLECNPSSEGFSIYVSKMYRLDPILFADMISDMPEERIKFIAKCIAADISKQGFSAPTVDLSTAPATLGLLAQTITDATAVSAERVEQSTPVSESLVSTTAYTPTVPTVVGINVSYDTSDYSEAQAGEFVYLDTTIEYTTSPSTLFVFYVELYEVKNGQNIYIGGAALAVPPGSIRATYSFRHAFTDVGSKSFLVKIYNQGKTTVLNSREFNNLLEIHGGWSVSVDLPKKRVNLGCLQLYDAGGACIYRAACLGLSESNANASVTYGNTPTGVFTGRLVGPDADTAAYGPYKVIHMTIIDSPYTNRSNICIHGGRDGTENSNSSHYPLAATNGCIRITSQFQGILIQQIETWIASSFYRQAGTVTVIEKNAETVDHPDEAPWYEQA